MERSGDTEVELEALDVFPRSWGGVPIFGVGSDDALPELRGREVEGVGARDGRPRVEMEGCGGEVTEPRPHGEVLRPDCLCRPAI